MLRRLIRRDRGFHALVVVLLALGIGSATLIFSVANEVVLKPLPVRDPENLYLLARTSPGELRPNDAFQERHYREIVLANRLVQAAVAEQLADPRSIVPLREGDRTRLVQAQAVSPNYFRELGVRAWMGRLLDESDMAEAVVSYHFWQSHYAGDRAVVGRVVRLRNTAFRIVGVLPREFHSSDKDRAPEFRIPMAAAAMLFAQDRDGVSYRLLLRLAPAASRSAVGPALLPGIRSLDDELAAARSERSDTVQFTMLVQPIARGVSRMRDQFAEALWLLLAGVGVLLLAVCANVAGLLIAKSADRRKEIGVRMALGAARGGVVRQLLMENLALGLVGATVGGSLQWLAARRIGALLPPSRDLAQFASPQLLSVEPDWLVFGFAAAVTILVVLVAGMVPAWRASRVDLITEIRASAGQRRQFRAGIVTAGLQAAFCIVLLSAAGLMFRSWWNLNHLDAGFDREHLVAFTIDPASAGYNMQQVGAVATEVQRRVDQLPGVRSTAWAWRALMRGSGIKTTVAPQGVVLPASTFLNASLNEVTSEYFDTMGQRVLSGRGLRLSDAAVQPTPVVVNQAFAAQFFGGRDAVGKLIVQGKDGTKTPNRVIVGVVNTAKYRSMREPDPPTIYGVWDASKGTDWQLHLYVRTDGPPAPVMGAVRQTMHDVDAGVPLVEVATMEGEIRASLWQERLVAILAAWFGAAATALAGIGLYAALTLSISQRRKEIGIRLAVGAQRRHVVAAVGWRLAAGVSCGALAGVVASGILLRVTRGLLYGVHPFDPLSILIASSMVAIVSAAAAGIPVRHALRVDPVTALREE